MVYVDFAPVPEPCFFFLMPKSWAFKYTQYFTSVNFWYINLQYFAILLDNNAKKVP